MVKYARNLIILQKKKKNGACVFWAPVSFLAGKLRHSKQMLLTEFQWIKKNPKKKKKRMRILGARIFSKFFGEKTKCFQTAVTEKNHEL